MARKKTTEEFYNNLISAEDLIIIEQNENSDFLYETLIDKNYKCENTLEKFKLIYNPLKVSSGLNEIVRFLIEARTKYQNQFMWLSISSNEPKKNHVPEKHLENSIEIVKFIESELEFIENGNTTTTKDKLTNAQQVLLLIELGFFKLDKVENLTAENKGLLVGYLLNRNEKNTEDFIRYSGGKRGSHNSNAYTKSNIKKVNELLEKLNLNKIE